MKLHDPGSALSSACSEVTYDPDCTGRGHLYSVCSSTLFCFVLRIKIALSPIPRIISRKFHDHHIQNRHQTALSFCQVLTNMIFIVFLIIQIIHIHCRTVGRYRKPLQRKEILIHTTAVSITVSMLCTCVQFFTFQLQLTYSII